jgi:pilus assembly protein CpaB
MKRRVVIILACAAIFAGCASYIVYRILGSHASATPQTPLVEVIVAAHDLEVGSLVGPHDLRTAKWFGALPKGAAARSDGILNRGVVAKVYEGEPVLVDRLSAPGAGGGLAATIPPGKRACAVKVNDVVGVAGFVLPGMRVDVLISGVPPGAPPDSGPRVKTLLQNIEVLSAGTNIQKNSDGKAQQVQVVNLLVDPAQAEILSLAGNESHIQLVLRNPMDTEITKPPGTAMAQLFDDAGAAAPKASTTVRRVPDHAIAASPVKTQLSAPATPQAVPTRTIEVINGLTRTDVRFPIAGE